MKHRFETQKSSSASKNFIISIIFFFMVIAVFTLGTTLVADRTDAQEQKTLEQLFHRGLLSGKPAVPEGALRPVLR